MLVPTFYWLFAKTYLLAPSQSYKNPSFSHFTHILLQSFGQKSHLQLTFCRSHFMGLVKKPSLFSFLFLFVYCGSQCPIVLFATILLAKKSINLLCLNFSFYLQYFQHKIFNEKLDICMVTLNVNEGRGSLWTNNFN